MGKVIEFKKFSKRINKDNLNKQDFSEDIFPEDDLVYVRREVKINLHEIDVILNCIYKQILVNGKLILDAENNYDFEKLTYLKDFNDKLHDVMYFLTNSSYQDPILVNLNFLEFKYLMGTLQSEVEIIKEYKDVTENESSLNYFKSIEDIYFRLSPIYNVWKSKIYQC